MEGYTNNSEKLPKMTQERMVEEIKSQYPSSRDFCQAVLDCVKNNWAMAAGADRIFTPNDVIHKLANHHRRWYGHDGNMLKGDGEMTKPQEGEEMPIERAKEVYAKAYGLGALATAIYHGEFQVVDDEGKLIDF